MGNKTKQAASGPTLAEQPSYTDSIFNLTREIVQNNAECVVTYVFMRRPVTLAPRLAVEWLQQMMQQRHAEIEIEHLHKEGA